MREYNIEYSSYNSFPTLLSYSGEEIGLCTIRQLDNSRKLCPIGIHILNETEAMYTWKLVYNPTIIFDNSSDNQCEVIKSPHTIKLNDDSVILASGISCKKEFTKDISDIFYEKALIDDKYISLIISCNRGHMLAYGSIIWRER